MLTLVLTVLALTGWGLAVVQSTRRVRLRWTQEAAHAQHTARRLLEQEVARLRGLVEESVPDTATRDDRMATMVELLHQDAAAHIEASGLTPEGLQRFVTAWLADEEAGI